MSRLTTRTEDGRAIIRLYSDPDADPNGWVEESARKNRESIEKLARYEDLNEIDPETGLKSCPFCGGKAVIASFTTLNSEKPKFEVECSNCWCETDWNNSTPEEAIAAWNRRVGEQE